LRFDEAIPAAIADELMPRIDVPLIDRRGALD
jgi:hypothetical protein